MLQENLFNPFKTPSNKLDPILFTFFCVLFINIHKNTLCLVRIHSFVALTTFLTAIMVGVKNKIK